MSARPVSPKSHNISAVHKRLDHQIATAPLRARVQARGPLREDPIRRKPPVSELQASVSGLGDEVRNCWREIRALRRDYDGLLERLERIEKGV